MDVRNPRRAAGRHSGLPRPLAGLLRLALIVVLGLAATEIALRLARPFSPALRHLLYEASLPAAFAPITTLPELMATTTLGWAPLEERDGYVLSSRSLPTPEYARQKAPGTLRILVLGDSFTFGRYPMSRHWTTLVADDLEQRTGTPVELIRFGVPGTGPPFQLRLFEIEGLALSPDVVVSAFFVGNDFFDELGGAFARGPMDRVALALRTRSLAWRFAGNVGQLTTALEPGATPPLVRTASTPADGVQGGCEGAAFARDFDDAAPSFTPAAYAEIEATRLSLCDPRATHRFQTRLARVLETIDALDETVRQSGARLAVVLIPDEFQVDPAVLAVAATHAGLRISDDDLERPQRELGRALDARGIPVVDLLPASRRAAPAGPLYRPRDTHWNAAGHRLAASEVANFLVERQIVQTGGPPNR